jgi:ankyrin repeat protein
MNAARVCVCVCKQAIVNKEYMPHGATALLMTAFHGHEETTRQLLAFGADQSIVAPPAAFFPSALHAALQNNNKDCARILIEDAKAQGSSRKVRDVSAG